MLEIAWALVSELWVESWAVLVWEALVTVWPMMVEPVLVKAWAVAWTVWLVLVEAAVAWVQTVQ